MTPSSFRPERWQSPEIFQVLGCRQFASGAATISQFHGPLAREQAIRKDLGSIGSYAGLHSGARNGSNYPLPDAVVDVIDRLVDLTAYPQITLEHRIVLQLWIYQRNVW